MFVALKFCANAFAFASVTASRVRCNGCFAFAFASMRCCLLLRFAPVGYLSFARRVVSLFHSSCRKSRSHVVAFVVAYLSFAQSLAVVSIDPNLFFAIRLRRSFRSAFVDPLGQRSVVIFA